MWLDIRLLGWNISITPFFIDRVQLFVWPLQRFVRTSKFILRIEFEIMLYSLIFIGVRLIGINLYWNLSGGHWHSHYNYSLCYHLHQFLIWNYSHCLRLDFIGFSSSNFVLEVLCYNLQVLTQLFQSLLALFIFSIRYRHPTTIESILIYRFLAIHQICFCFEGMIYRFLWVNKVLY